MIEAKTACYVVQTVAILEDEFDFDGMVEAEHVHKRRFASFSQKIRTDLNLPDALPLSVGTCTLCPSCSCPDAPCRYPERAFNSMEAAGFARIRRLLSRSHPLLSRQRHHRLRKLRLGVSVSSC